MLQVRVFVQISIRRSPSLQSARRNHSCRAGLMRSDLLQKSNHICINWLCLNRIWGPGRDKLWPRGHDVVIRARTLWADERLREPERELDWVRVSQRESEKARENRMFACITMNYKNREFCRETLEHSTFCHKSAVHAFWAKKKRWFAWRADPSVFPALVEAPLATLFLMILTIMMDENDDDYGDDDSEWMVLKIDNPALFSSPAPVSCHQSSPCAPTVCSR